MNKVDAFLAYILFPFFATMVGVIVVMAYLTWGCPTMLPC